MSASRDGDSLDRDAGTPEHVVLVGLMGSGKTTIGRRIAARLGRPFRDSDAALLERHGLTAREIGRARGLPYLHRLEAEILLDDLAGSTISVIAAAASTADDAACVEALLSDRAIVVWLRGSVPVVAARARTADHRPYQAGLDEAIARQALARGPTWARTAGLVLDVEELTPDRAVEMIAAHVQHDFREPDRPGFAGDRPSRRGAR